MGIEDSVVEEVREVKMPGVYEKVWAVPSMRMKEWYGWSYFKVRSHA